MTNRGIYQRDPDRIRLLNNGVAAMTDAVTGEERRTLRFELEHLRLRRPVPGRPGPDFGFLRRLPGSAGAGGRVDQRLLRQRQVAHGEDVALLVDGLRLPGRRRQRSRPGTAA